MQHQFLFGLNMGFKSWSKHFEIGHLW